MIAALRPGCYLPAMACRRPEIQPGHIAALLGGNVRIEPFPVPRDCLDGFGEAFRRMSFDEIGPHAILSRATAGVVNRCLVYSLPGSTRGSLLGVQKLVIPTLEHAVELAIGRDTHTSGFPPPPGQGPFRSP